MIGELLQHMLFLLNSSMNLKNIVEFVP